MFYGYKTCFMDISFLTSLYFHKEVLFALSDHLYPDHSLLPLSHFFPTYLLHSIKIPTFVFFLIKLF